MLAVYLAAGTAGAAPAPATQPVATQTPEQTFAPLVSLHSSEPIAPMSVDEFLRNSKLFWAFHSSCPTRKKPIAGPLTTTEQWRALGSGGFSQAGGCGEGAVYKTSYYTRPYDKGRKFHHRKDLTGREGFYLDVDQDVLGKRKPATVTEGGQRVLEPSPPVYFERHDDEVGADGIKNVRFTYWFFYPFNTPTKDTDVLKFLGRSLDHEGDWERISVLTRNIGADLWLPLSVRFHQHDRSVPILWKDVLKVSDDSGVVTHPRAFVAKGNHATYPGPGRFPHTFSVFGVHVTVYDEVQACRRCPRWATWTHPEMLVDATQQPWYGFGGAWGKVGIASDFTGPLGPSLLKTVPRKVPPPPAPPAPG